MSEPLENLNKDLLRKLCLIILIEIGILSFFPFLWFLVAGFSELHTDYWTTQTIGLILNNMFNLIIGLLVIFVGLYIFWFVYRNRETYRKHLKGVLAILISGSFDFAVGTFFLYVSFPYHPNGIVITSDIMTAFIPFSHSLAISFFSIVVGMALLIRNYQSSVTRFLFLSYLTFGGTWLVFIIYSFSFRFFLNDGVTLTPVLYLGFYLSFFLGMMFLIQGCWRLIKPSSQRFPRWFFFILGIVVVATCFFSFTELTHYIYYTPFGDLEILYLREHSLIFSVVYSGSLIIPLLFSIYLLSKPPPWITKERGNWIKKARISLILLSFYPLVEVVSGLRGLPFFSDYITLFNPAPVKVSLLMGSISLIYFSYGIMFVGVSDVNKWFFDEVKCRATPELQKLDPDVNLAKIWEKIDQMQKEQPLSQREMTNQKVEQYVQTAVNYWMSLENSRSG
ncbi:MAG: hypothetical protein ACFFAU_18600 [Candidatus Hodarchaeota archaeon]